MSAESHRLAADGGAQLATLSPVWHTPGKGAALGLPRFGQLASGGRLPVFALGGVTAPRIGPLCAAGARGVALIREIFEAADPALATAECLTALDAARAAAPIG